MFYEPWIPYYKMPEVPQKNPSYLSSMGFLYISSPLVTQLPGKLKYSAAYQFELLWTEYWIQIFLALCVSQ